jgi:hypothetical protein
VENRLAEDERVDGGGRKSYEGSCMSSSASLICGSRSTPQVETSAESVYYTHGW